MKKYIRTIHSAVGAAALLMGTTAALTACSSDNDEIATTGTRTLTLNCGIGTTDSKAGSRAGVTYGGTDESKETFIWHEGDQFEAWLINSTSNGFETTKPLFTIDSDYKDDDRKGSASFTCTDFPTDRAYDIVAIYPQGKAGNTQLTKLDCTLETTQTQKGNSAKHLSDNMFMYATATVPQGGSAPTSLTFHHMTSLLRFTVKNENAQECKLKKIVINATDKDAAKASVFGRDLSVYNDNVFLVTKTDILTLNTQTESGESVSIASGSSYDAYMVTGTCQPMVGTIKADPSLKDKTLIFTLTVTDADGTNERTFTSMALDANRIVNANDAKETWEPGKRYWFDLTLKDKLTVESCIVGAWATETGSEITGDAVKQ